MIETAIATAIGAFIGGAIAGFVAWLLNSGTRRRLDELEEHRVVALERKVEHHMESDETQGIKSDLKHISSQLTAISAQMEIYKRDTNELRAQREADLDYLKNLDQSMQRHKREGHQA